MAWTTPRTWTTGEIVTAAMLNEQVRDNMLALFSRRFGHTYIIGGDIKVASGNTDYIPPFFISEPSGQVVTLIKCRYRINAGTSVTFKLQRNLADITGFTSMSATTTTAETTPTAVGLADNDAIAPVVTAVSGTPQNMTVGIFLNYEVA